MKKRIIKYRFKFEKIFLMDFLKNILEYVLQCKNLETLELQSIKAGKYSSRVLES